MRHAQRRLIERFDNMENVPIGFIKKQIQSGQSELIGTQRFDKRQIHKVKIKKTTVQVVWDAVDEYVVTVLPRTKKGETPRNRKLKKEK